MTEDIDEDDVAEFLDNNPLFVRNWLSEHGLLEMANTIDTDIYHLPVANAFINYVEGILLRNKVKQRRPSKMLTENEMFKELIKDITYELDVDVLSHKILKNICILTQCDRASLFLVRGTDQERYLISKLFNVTADSILDESVHREEDAIRIPFGKGIAGHVAETKNPVNIKDVYRDHRFLDEVDKMTGFRTRCILCMPILDKDEHIMGVVQIMNKRKEEEYFTAQDEKTCGDFLSFCGIGINNAQLFEITFEEYTRNQLLLRLAKCIFKVQDNLKKLIAIILEHAMDMLNCKCISVYIIDQKKEMDGFIEFSKVFQLVNGETEIREACIDPRYTKAAIENINSGNVLLVTSFKDSSKDSTNIKSDVGSWLLCMTISDYIKNSVGCIMFIRDSMDIFSRNDICMMETFALFCGLGIHNCQLYETSVKSLAQQQVAMGLLVYHSIASQEELDRHLKLKVLQPSDYNIYSFEFNDLVLSDESTVLACVCMFMEMNALSILKISRVVLYRWILTVRKNYRNIRYHNWRHGVNVFQTMFCMITTGNLKMYFSEFEQICLLAACLSHDLDHRGTNNAYQVKVASPFATLYSTSILEHHHFDHSIRIMNSEENNIFQNLSSNEYKKGLKLIEKAILATDLVIYFEKRNLFKHQVETGDKPLKTEEQIDLLLCMMMTASDLSAITKPWEIQKKVALLVADEFFEQGDMEKRLLQENVMPLMDRDKRSDIPKMQVGFIDFVCVMVYKLLSQLEENLAPLYNGCLKNREHWSNIANNMEEFDVDAELENVRAGIFGFSESLIKAEVENGIDQQESPVIEGEKPASPSQKTMFTQTTMTLCSFDQIQKIIQTDISLTASLAEEPTSETGLLSSRIEELQPKILSSVIEHLPTPVETKLRSCQTDITLRALSEITVQTETVSTQTENIFSEQTPPDKDEESTSGFRQPSDQEVPLMKRRMTCLDMVIDEKRIELEKKKEKIAPREKKEEVPQQIRRKSYVFLPPNPVRQSSSTPRASELSFGNDSKNVSLQSIDRSSSTSKPQLGEEDVISAEHPRKESLKSEKQDQNETEPKVIDRRKSKPKSTDIKEPKPTRTREDSLSRISARKGSLTFDNVGRKRKVLKVKEKEKILTKINSQKTNSCSTS